VQPARGARAGGLELGERARRVAAQHPHAAARLEQQRELARRLQVGHGHRLGERRGGGVDLAALDEAARVQAVQAAEVQPPAEPPRVERALGAGQRAGDLAAVQQRRPGAPRSRRPRERRAGAARLVLGGPDDRERTLELARPVQAPGDERPRDPVRALVVEQPPARPRAVAQRADARARRGGERLLVGDLREQPALLEAGGEGRSPAASSSAVSSSSTSGRSSASNCATPRYAARSSCPSGCPRRAASSSARAAW